MKFTLTHLAARLLLAFITTTTTTLLIATSLLSTPANGLVARIPRGSSPEALSSFEKRQLRAETLDGSIVEPVVVDYLDQFQYYQNEVDNGNLAAGTPEFSSLVDETRSVSVILSDLIRNYATIVSGPAPLPEETATTVADDPENTDFPTIFETSESPPITVAEPPSGQEPTTTAAPAPTPRPTASTSGPFTVVARPNTSVVVVTSGTRTETVTVQPTLPGPGRGQGGTPTTFVTVRGGVTQTIVAVAASSTVGPSNKGIVSATWSPTLGLVSAGVMGVLMGFL